MVLSDANKNCNGDEMKREAAQGLAWSRTHIEDAPDNRMGADRRKGNCFIAKDRRSGIACRRKERQREMERRLALAKVTFYPEYFRIV